jgi:hypothetical protein
MDAHFRLLKRLAVAADISVIEDWLRTLGDNELAALLKRCQRLADGNPNESNCAYARVYLPYVQDEDNHRWLRQQQRASHRRWREARGIAHK